ncbi:hypothetical protein KC19_VG288800 [Ceratodon purpureus]|uniref:Uncharacterized protein n=1 Tax=Ceratodon purpureus TaxID=3225 RepID=A0A8T0HUN2_CERPU|nr:hypothetical protein KC19_VG288800 [Ceratodon purpureus]
MRPRVLLCFEIGCFAVFLNLASPHQRYGLLLISLLLYSTVEDECVSSGVLLSLMRA